MTDDVRHAVPPEKLSGYLDGELTQQEGQQVRLHLEQCASCRAEFEEMQRLREVAMSTHFSVPTDDQWDERPQSGASKLSFGVGWIVLTVWLVGVFGFALGSLWSDTQSLGERLLVFGGLSGVALLFLSVLLDRMKNYSTDRYRRVKK